MMAWRHVDGRYSETRPSDFDEAIENAIALHLEMLRPWARQAHAQGASAEEFGRVAGQSLQDSVRGESQGMWELAMEAGLRALAQVTTETWGVSCTVAYEKGGAG